MNVFNKDEDVNCVTVYSVGGGVDPPDPPLVPPDVPPEVPPLLPPLVPPEDDPVGWETVSPPPPPQAAKVNIITNDAQNRTIKPMHHETKTPV